MPKKVSKGGGGDFNSAFSAAVVNHRTDETTYSASGDLPAGIEGGIAKLAMGKIGEYQKGDQKGEKFFMLQGVVVSPTEYEGQRIEGLRTNLGPEPLCDTPDRESRPTLDDHVAWVLNQLRMLGGDECVAEVETLEDLEEVVDALVEADIYFRFRTWKGDPTKEYPNPRVKHEWKGATEYEESGEDEVEDETEEEEEPKKPAPKKPVPKGKTVPKGKPTTKPSSTTTSTKGGKATKPTKKKEEEDVPYGDDLDMLADAAEEDAEAADRLSQLAVEAGLEEEWVESAPSWADVAQAIRDAEGGEEQEEEEQEEEEQEAQPEKGETYAYKPKGKKKAIEVEITAVFEGKQNCNCKDEDGTVYKSVPWSALEAL